MKFFIAIFNISLIGYTTEAFPTNMRSQVIGLCFTFGRIGVLFIPFYLELINNSTLTNP